MLLTPRRRALLWMGWPLFVLVAGVALPHFTRFWFGYGFEWLREGPAPWQVVQIVWVMLVPPLVIEIVFRIVRSTG